MLIASFYSWEIKEKFMLILIYIYIYIIKGTCVSHVQGSWRQWARHGSWERRYCQKTLVSSDCFGIVMSTESTLDYWSGLACHRCVVDGVEKTHFRRWQQSVKHFVWLDGAYGLPEKISRGLMVMTSTQRQSIWCCVGFCV